MLSIEQTKRLLGNPQLSDHEAEEIRDISYMLAELVFEKWRQDQLSDRQNQLDGSSAEGGSLNGANSV
jgi:hypothetical protein